jgi:RND family efflux transporter MFP subunit
VSFDCSIQRAQLERAQAEQSGAERTLASNVELEKLNSVGQLELDLSRTAVQRSKAEVALHTAQLGKCVIHAPFTGRVAEQKVREQQFAQPGQPLLEIIEDGPLELEFIVPSRWLTWLKAGGRLKVSIDETGRSYPARFTRIGARVDPVSQSVKVVAAIDGRFPELIAGMSGRIEVDVPPGR